MMGRDPQPKKRGPHDEPDEHVIPDTPSPEGREEATGLDETQALIEKLRAEVAELNAKYLRTLADYHNSQRRAAGNEREARQQGMTAVIQSVLPVLDHFDLALGVDMSRASAEQVVGGVKVIRDELMKVLQSQGVGIISPAPGDEFDPKKHQAVTHQDVPGVQPGRVAATLQAGYTLGDRMIRPAMVSVAKAE
jgi:molecular chaperone GrpE